MANNESARSSQLMIEIPEERKCSCPKILVVDPNPMNQCIVSSSLDNLQVPNKIAQDEEIAIGLVKERKRQGCCNHFSIVLVNGNCKEIDSFELAQKIRTLCESESCSIVILSDQALSSDTEKVASHST